jgi:diadenosine tetraphosphate (Ap4A) HIT family hydrolase
MTDCYTCAQETGLATAPMRERIGYDDHWRVAHAITTSVPGWLVLIPRRHVTTVAELTDAEAAGLGSWQVRVSRALHAELECSKTYVIQFAEARRFGHVHFHLVPRMPDLTDVGPKIFAHLGVPAEQQVSEAEMDSVAVRLSSHLTVGA